MAKRKPSGLFGGRLGREAVDAVTRANKIVARGVRKLADRELKAVEDYYSALAEQLDAVKRGENVRDVALQQLDVMRGTVLTMLEHARDSLGIVGDVRKELQRLSQAGEAMIDGEAIHKVVASAEQAWQQVKAEAAAVEAEAVAAVTGKRRQRASKPADAVAASAEAPSVGGDTEPAAPAVRKRGRPAKQPPATASVEVPRKRGRPPKAKPEQVVAEVPRRRGRPPKAKPEAAAVEVAVKRGRPAKASTRTVEPAPEASRKRGRPPRIKAEPAAVEAPRKRGRPPKSKPAADAATLARPSRKSASMRKAPSQPLDPAVTAATTDAMTIAATPAPSSDTPSE